MCEDELLQDYGCPNMACPKSAAPMSLDALFCLYTNLHVSFEVWMSTPLIPVSQQQMHTRYANKCDSFHAQRNIITHNISRLITSRIDLRRSTAGFGVFDMLSENCC